MPKRIIVIAQTKAEGIAAADRAGDQLVAVLTPRSGEGARGRCADAIVTLPSMLDHPRIEQLRLVAQATV